MGQKQVKNFVINLTKTKLEEILRLAIEDWEKGDDYTTRGLCSYFLGKYEELNEKDYLLFVLSSLWNRYAEFDNGIYLWSLVIERRKKRIEALKKVLEDVLKAYPDFYYDEHIAWSINGVLTFLKKD